jgi:hypothetical protein
MRVSSSTSQAILIKHEMGTKFDRLFKLAAQAAAEPLELSAEQLAAIEAANPCFRWHHVESAAPGQLLSQDTYFVDNFKGVGKVYPDSFAGTFGSYALGLLHTSKMPKCALAVLHNGVLPCYQG